MKSRKGQPKTGGRTKGTPNKATQEVKSLARGMLDSPTYRKRILEQLLAGTLDTRMRADC